MIITPADINSYLYCPVRHFLKRKEKKDAADVWLDKIKEAIVRTEKRVLLHDSFITVKKINRVWDDVWWEYGFKVGMDVDKMKKLTVAASIKFSDYCKFDFSSDMFQTLGVDISLSKQYSSDIELRSHIDIVKRDIRDNTKHLYLINVDSLNEDTIHTNIGLAANIIPFFISGCEIIHYINVDFSKRKLKVSRYTFKEKHLSQYNQPIFYLARGIRSKIEYPNMFNCKECNICNEIPNIRQ